MNSSDNIQCNKCSKVVDRSHRFCKNCGNTIEHFKPKEITCFGIRDDKPCANIIGPNCGTENTKAVSGKTDEYTVILLTYVKQPKYNICLYLHDLLLAMLVQTPF